MSTAYKCITIRIKFLIDACCKAQMEINVWLTRKIAFPVYVQSVCYKYYCSIRNVNTYAHNSQFEQYGQLIVSGNKYNKMSKKS